MALFFLHLGGNLMINLDVFMEKTIDYMIGGKLVKVKEPTYDFMSKFAGIGTDENGMEMLYTLLQKYLNNKELLFQIRHQFITNYTEAPMFHFLSLRNKSMHIRVNQVKIRFGRRD